MAELTVNIYRIKIESHPNADLLELAVVGDYRSIVQKNMYADGELVAYIPCQSIVPDDIIESLGLTGRLAGRLKNRVKEIKLRGILSEGLIYPTAESASGVLSISRGTEHQMVINEGDDVTEFLGITKWVPPIPQHMAGEVYNAGLDCTIKYDVSNFKKYNTVFTDDEPVIFTEKLHGTFMMFGVMPPRLHDDNHYDRRCIVASKGLGGNGQCFKHNDINAKNVYIRTMHQYNLPDINIPFDAFDEPLWILGEVYGVQDLKYGLRNGEIGFRVFDVCYGQVRNRTWLGDQLLDRFCSVNELERVPVLYRGAFSKEAVIEYANGKETVSGNEDCIREGIIIRPAVERYDGLIGRCQLKYVSDAYLTRGGKTTENS